MEERMENLEKKFDQMLLSLTELGRERRRGRTHTPRRPPNHVDSTDRWNEGNGRDGGSPPTPPHHRTEFQRSPSPDRESRSSLRYHEDRRNHRDSNQRRHRTPYHYDDYRYHQTRSPERRLDMPVFSGDDALGWLTRIERYFVINDIEGEERLESVMVALEDRALNWYQSFDTRHPFFSWRQFREALLRRFQPGSVHDPLGPLLRLRQERSVLAYIEEFEKVARPLSRVDPEVLKSVFINGLSGPLRAELKSLELGSLGELKNRALLLEERNREWRNAGGGPTDRGPPHDQPASNTPRSAPPSTQGMVERKTHPVSAARRLTQEELQDRSRRGLCFKCGERWGQGHTCKMKNFKLVIMEDSSADATEAGEPGTKEAEFEDDVAPTLSPSSP